MKNKPNHKLYLRILRAMSPEDRLRKAYELSDFSRALFAHGMRRRLPELSAAELDRITRERLDKCRNRIY